MRLSLVVTSPLALIAVPLASTTEPPTSSARPHVETMLAMVPATAFELGSAATLVYIDMDAAWNVLGAAPEQDLLPDVGMAVGGPQLFNRMWMDVAGAEAEVGFSTLGIAREISVLAPPSALIVDVTRVAPDEIVGAIESNPTWSPELSEIETDHGSYFSWGEGLEIHPDRRSPFRPLGQGGQFAVFGDEAATTVRTLSSIDMEATLATIDGGDDSLASSPLLSPVVDLLGDNTVLILMSVPHAPSFMPPLTASPEAVEQFIEQFAEYALRPYLSVTIADVVTGDGRAGETYLVHADGETAAENLERVELALAEGDDLVTGRPLSEVLPDADATVEGRVIRITVPGEHSFRVMSEMLFRRSLFPTGI